MHGELPAGLCVVSGTAFGSVTGMSGTAAGLSLGFNWTRVGPVALVTVSGDSTGTGVATFQTRPGVPCGGPVRAGIAGTVTGV